MFFFIIIIIIIIIIPCHGMLKKLSMFACVFPVCPFDVHPIHVLNVSRNVTYHTPWFIIPLEKLTVTQLVEKFPTF